MNNTTNSTGNFVAYFTRDVDIVFGLIYVVIGVFGLYTNGSVIVTFWKLRTRLKMVPFIICAIAVSHSDFATLLFVTLPYGVLLLANRPMLPNIPCFIIGFVCNFCRRFAWFVITSIMVFRCITILRPLKTRNSPLSIFYCLIIAIATFCFILSFLPIFSFKFMVLRYTYIRNVHECAYSLSDEYPGFVALIDVVLWGPFITCIVSSILFSVTLKAHFGKMKVTSLNDKKCMAIKKTFVLTMFFIVCYLPISALTTLGFMAGKEFLLTYADIANFGYTRYLYILLFCQYIITGARAAFTPVMLRLKLFIFSCCSTSKRSKHDPRTGISESRNNKLETEDETKKLMKLRHNSSSSLLKSMEKKLSMAIARPRSVSVPASSVDEFRQTCSDSADFKTFNKTFSIDATEEDHS